MNRIGSIVLSISLLTCLACSLFAQSPGGRTAAPSGNIVKNAGDEVPFTLVARDNNGLVIRGWNTSGKDINLVVSNCGANTDAEPLTVMTIKDANGNPLSQLGANIFLLPKTLFVDGAAEIVFMTTKADTGVFISVVPSTGGLNTIGETMDFLPGPATNFRTEIVPATPPDTVYLMRKYELRVTPRDRYNNPNESAQILSRFTARYPGEFSTADGGAGLFAGEVFIQGTTDYFLTSSQSRTNQEIVCYASADPNLRGSTGPYVVADHAPGAFSLINPPDGGRIRYNLKKDTIRFLWQPSTDRYANIPVGNQIVSDQVSYTFVIADSITHLIFLELPSHNSGADDYLTITHEIAKTWMTRFGIPKYFQFEWYVRATDGLYITRSTDIRHLTFLDLSGDDVGGTDPVAFRLSQNYPNPFALMTFIGFDIYARNFVTLEVLDPVGRKVARLVNGERDQGSYTCTFDARNLPSGNYLVRLTAGGRSIARMMTLMR